MLALNYHKILLSLSSFLLVNYNETIAQSCCATNESPPQPTFYAPLVPVPPKTNNPNWQPVTPVAANEQKPKEPIVSNSPGSNNSSCTCDFTKFDSLFLRITALEQHLTNLTNVKCEPTDLGPLQKQIAELKYQIDGMKHPLVVNLPPETTTPKREIIYLTGLDCNSCQKTDVEVSKLRKYDAINLTTVVIKTKEVSVIKDLPQLIILPEKEQIVGELNVLFYLTSLMKTETTPLAPIPVK